MSLKTRFATFYDPLDDYFESKAWYQAFNARLRRFSIKHKALNANLEAHNDRLRRRVSRDGTSPGRGHIFKKPANASETALLCWLSLLVLLVLLAVVSNHLSAGNDAISSPAIAGRV